VSQAIEEARGEVARVSTLELFFDLVFVFTITQLTTVLVEESNLRGLFQTVLMLGVIWWMYGGYAWLTNTVAPDRTVRRLVLLAGMASYLVLALAIPRAFGDDGTAFGLAYLGVVAVHTALFLRGSTESVARAIMQIAPFNAVTAAVVLAGGIAGGTAQYVLWTVAFLGEWISGILTGDEGFVISPGHFVERHGLVVIVAIGESVVAIGIGAGHLPLDLELAAVAVLGLLLTAGLWWIYFGGDDQAAERALRAAPQPRRPRMALNAFGIWHMPILLGIIATASALKVVTAHPGHSLEAGQAVALGGGVAVYLLGEVLFRRSLGIGDSGVRVAAAAAALATIPLGTGTTATVQVAALVLVLVAALAGEARVYGTTAPARSP
jgi:low temperature requirement protein LtrA